MPYINTIQACCVRDAIVIPSFYRIRVDGRNIHKYVTCSACIFFENRGKNYPFSRISGYISAGTKVTLALPLIKSENVRRAMKAQKVTSRSE